MSSQKRVTGVTERLARACSSHPWWTLGAWGLAVVASVALAVTSLSGLSSDQHVTGKLESAKAADVIAQAFPPSAAERKRTVSDVIVVSSKRLTTDSPAFRGFVAQLTGRVHAAATDVGVQNYLAGDRSLVAPSRHATVIQLNAPSDSSIKPVVTLVKKTSTQNFAVAVTGDHTVNNDFANLSQTDLQNGELAFGLPAAMIVLVLVFGAVVAGLVPVVMALLSILVGLGLVALLSLEFNSQACSASRD